MNKNEQSTVDDRLPQLVLLEALNSVDTHGVLILDSEFNIVSWNKGAENVFGYKRVEVIGKPLFTLLKLEKRELFCWKTIFAEIQAGKEKVIYNAVCLDWRGRSFPVEFNFSMIGDYEYCCVKLRDLSYKCQNNKDLLEIFQKRQDLIIVRNDLLFFIKDKLLLPLDVFLEFCNNLQKEGLGQKELQKDFLSSFKGKLNVLEYTLRDAHKTLSVYDI